MRLIEIPDDGIIKIPIMVGEDTIGYRNIDLSDFPSVEVDGEKIKADTWYMLENGKLVEVDG